MTEGRKKTKQSGYLVSFLGKHWKAVTVLVVALVVLSCEGVLLLRKQRVPTTAKPAEAFFIPLRGPNMKLPQMYDYGPVLSTLERKPRVNLTTMGAELDAFISKYNLRDNSSTSWPHEELPFVAGSEGAATTCRLNALCLASLLVLHNVTRGTLPLELWVEAPLPPERAAALSALFGPRLRVRAFAETDAAYAARFGALEPALFRNVFHRKVQTLASSAFARVLWVDSDAFVLRDPRTALPADAGLVLWRDMSVIDTRNPVWALLHTAPVAGYGGESGAVLVDKGRAGAARALQLAAYMNQHQNAFYRLVYGDKDTFFLAARALGVPSTLLPFLPTVVGRRSFLQAAPDGTPFFVHLPGPGKKDFVGAMHSADPRGFWGRIPRFDPNSAHVGRVRGRLLAFADSPSASIVDHDPAAVVGAENIQLIHSMFKLAEDVLRRCDGTNTR